MKTTNVKTTTEICRITFNDGDFKRLIVQTYFEGEPFYAVKQGTHNFTPVETSNENLDVIIAHMKKCVLVEKTHYSKLKNNENVVAIANEIIAKEEEFISMIEKYNIDAIGGEDEEIEE